jgi:hypothetical protein
VTPTTSLTPCFASSGKRRRTTSSPPTDSVTPIPTVATASSHVGKVFSSERVTWLLRETLDAVRVRGPPSLKNTAPTCPAVPAAIACWLSVRPAAISQRRRRAS